MDGSAHLVAGEGGDHPLDLPPVAKADDIVVVAAPLGAGGGLEAGIVAEPLDQIGGVVKGRTAGDERGLHGPTVNPRPVSRLPTSVVNSTLTMSDGAPKKRVMKKTPLAGGFFLVAPIVIGFAAGLATGDAMRGVIIGTAIGIAFAVALWLVDRRRA